MSLTDIITINTSFHVCKSHKYICQSTYMVMIMLQTLSCSRVSSLRACNVDATIAVILDV